MTGAGARRASRTSRPRHRLKILDRAFFLLESDEATCHVGLLSLFTPPAGAGRDFVGNLVAGMRAQTEVAVPFNYKLAQLRLPLQIGPWIELDSDEVDLDYHFRHSALPHPGTQRELGILISRLHSRPLDPTRPMWELHIIEGLEDDRFAMYFKVHHSLMDGVTGTGTFTQSLSEDPRDGVGRPIWTVNRGRGNASTDDTGRARRTARSQRFLTAAKVFGGLLHYVLGLARRRSGPRDADLAAPFLGPVSPTLNGRVSRQRRVVTQTYELDRFRAVSVTAGVSPNDVFLAVCAGALGRYLAEIEAPTGRSLTASVPVSLRQSSNAGGGNALGMLAAKLHTDLVDAVQRLHAINRSTAKAKDGLQRLPAVARPYQTALATSPLMVQSLIGVAGRGGRPHANLVLSNVPGPSGQLYLGGARLDEAYPLSMLMHGQTLNITAFSTGGRVNIGVVGCRDQLPHLQKMATYLADALAELEAGVLTEV